MPAPRSLSPSDASLSGEVPKIKGAGFIEILRWYASIHGTDRLMRAEQKLPPELRSFITRPTEPAFGLLAGTWYPAELVRLVFAEMTADLTPIAARQLAAEAVKASVGTTLSGIYQGIFRMLVSPKLLAEHYQKLWRLYHNTGEFKVLNLSSTRQDFQLWNWPGHDPFICQMNFYATKLILEMIGMKEVTGQMGSCVATGGDHCSYIQSWK